MRLTFGLCNPEYGGDTKRIKKYFHILYGMTEEHMEVQEETVFHMIGSCKQK